MDKYKYVHIFTYDSGNFNKRVIDLILNNRDDFDISEHLFVTTYEELYDEVHNVCAIILCTNVTKYSTEMINQYGDMGDIIIVHGFPQNWFKNFDIREDLCDKIVWRMWGPDASLTLCYPNFKSIIMHIKWVLHGDYKLIWGDIKSRRGYKRINSYISKFRAVGIGDDIVDRYVISNVLGVKKDLYVLPYPKGDEYASVLENVDNKNDDGLYHILVGHSGIPMNNHIGIIDRLKKYERENIKLHFPLSYGDDEYIKKVKSYIESNWIGQYEIIENSMSFSDYVKYISLMDAAILEGTMSYALGNLALLTTFGKKIFLNREGVLAKSLESRKVVFEYSDVVGEVSFENLIQDIGSMKNIYDEYGNYRVSHFSKGVEYWKNFLNTIIVEENDD